jgi:hypothetical protein
MDLSEILGRRLDVKTRPMLDRLSKVRVALNSQVFDQRDGVCVGFCEIVLGGCGYGKD